nr:MAG TPA: hypothetical protein [Caudoviricetes sp.]
MSCNVPHTDDRRPTEKLPALASDLNRYSSFTWGRGEELFSQLGQIFRVGKFR